MTYTHSRFLDSLMTALPCYFILCGIAISEPVVLYDSQMDKITAGSEYGGVIIGDHSESIINTHSGILITDNVQQVTKGINLVNSNSSSVANTINIWDGKVIAFSEDDDQNHRALEVNQLNNIHQKQNHNALLTGYSRPGEEFTDIHKHSTSNAYFNETANIYNTTYQYQEFNHLLSQSTASVNTTTKFSLGDKIHFEGNLGQGVAVAGHADIMIDGGSVELAMAAGAGISVSAGIGQGDSDLEIGAINLGESSASAGVGISANIALIAKVDLPKVNIIIDGAGCGVVMGSCNAASDVIKTSVIHSNNSQLDIMEYHQAANNSFSDEHIQIRRSAFFVEQAKGEYIVIDDSKLNLDSDLGLDLSGNVQKDAEGMNIVNAVGSNVANSSNISRASHFETQRSSLVLNQFNTIIHGN